MTIIQYNEHSVTLTGSVQTPLHTAAFLQLTVHVNLNDI